MDNLSDCLICALEKFQLSPTGLESMTSAMPVQFAYQLRAMKLLRCDEVNLLGSWVPVKGMMSERNVVENELKKCSSHLLDNLSDGAHMRQSHIYENRWNCPANKLYRIGNLLTSSTIVLSFLLLSSFFFCFSVFICSRLKTRKRSWSYKKVKIRLSRNTEKFYGFNGASL